MVDFKLFLNLGLQEREGVKQNGEHHWQPQFGAMGTDTLSSWVKWLSAVSTDPYREPLTGSFSQVVQLGGCTYEGYLLPDLPGGAILAMASPGTECIAHT